MNAIKRDKTLSKKSQKKPPFTLKPRPQPQARRQKMPLKSLLKRPL